MFQNLRHGGAEILERAGNFYQGRGLGFFFTTWKGSSRQVSFLLPGEGVQELFRNLFARNVSIRLLISMVHFRHRDCKVATTDMGIGKYTPNMGVGG